MVIDSSRDWSSNVIPQSFEPHTVGRPVLKRGVYWSAMHGYGSALSMCLSTKSLAEICDTFSESQQYFAQVE